MNALERTKPSSKAGKPDFSARRPERSLLGNLYDVFFTESGRPRVISWIILAALASRCIYIYGFSDYKNYLYADMVSYWNRANDRYNGQVFTHSQWNCQAILTHILMAKLFHVMDLFDMNKFHLEGTLFVFVVLACVGIYYFNRLGAICLKSASAAIWTAGFYAFTFPLIFLNSFILTENIATPILIASNYLTVKDPRSTRHAAWSAALLGLGVSMRPAFLFLAGANVLFYLFEVRRTVSFKAAVRVTAVFTGVFVGCVMLACLHTAFISKGNIKGLGANGGVTVYLRKCHVGKVSSSHPMFNGWFAECMHLLDNVDDDPNWPLMNFKSRSLIDDKYYYSQTWKSIQNNPSVILEQVIELKYYVVGNFFPPPWRRTSAFDFLFNGFGWLFVIGAPIALCVCPLFLFFRKDYRHPALVFLWLVLAATAATGMIFSTDRRYLVPTYHLIYLLCISLGMYLFSKRRAIAAAALDRKVVGRVLAGAFFLALLFQGGRALAGWYGSRPLPVTVVDRKVPDGLAARDLLLHLSFDGTDTSAFGPVRIHGTSKTEGRHGQALRFDGKRDYIDLGTISEKFDRGLTIAFWAYPTRMHSWFNFVNLGDIDSDQYIAICNPGKSNDLQFQTSGGVTPSPERRLFAAGAIDMNEWQHFAVVYDPGGHSVLYKNGVPIARGKIEPPDTGPRGSCFVAKSSMPRDYNYRGKLDELYIMKRPLSRAQVEGLMALGPKPEKRD